MLQKFKLNYGERTPAKIMYRLPGQKRNISHSITAARKLK
jgi:hypothetical protein